MLTCSCVRFQFVPCCRQLKAMSTLRENWTLAENNRCSVRFMFPKWPIVRTYKWFCYAQISNCTAGLLECTLWKALWLSYKGNQNKHTVKNSSPIGCKAVYCVRQQLYNQTWHDLIALPMSIACGKHSESEWAEAKESIVITLCRQPKKDINIFFSSWRNHTKTITRRNSYCLVQTLNSWLMHFHVALYLIIHHTGAALNRVWMPHRYKQLNNSAAGMWGRMWCECSRKISPLLFNSQLHLAVGQNGDWARLNIRFLPACPRPEPAEVHVSGREREGEKNTSMF